MLRRPDSGAGAASWQANASSLVVGRLLIAVLGWAGTIIVARNLDQEQFGQFTFVFGLLGMMAIVTDLGLGRVALSGVMPEADEPREFGGSYIALRTSLGLLGYVLAVGFTVVANYPAIVIRATVLGGVVVILATVSHAYELILQANLRMPVVALAAVIGRLAQLAITVAVAIAGGSLIWFVVPAIVAELVIMAVKIPQATRLLPIRIRPQTHRWGPMLREAIPISIGTALATLYFRVDSIMLSKLDDFVAVGIYGVAFKFVDVLHWVALSISTPVLTVLVRAWPDRLEEFRSTLRSTAQFTATGAGLLVVHFALFADDTIELLYGPRFSDGAVAAQILIAAELLAFPSVLALTVLNATGRMRTYPYVALAGLVLNIALNTYAIPRWSFNGAAVTTVITELVILIAMGWLVWRIRPLWPLRMGGVLRVLPPVAAGVAVGLGVDAVAHWLVAAAVASIAYVATAQLVGALRMQSVLPALTGSRSGGSDDGPPHHPGS